jgi:ParB-like chromosome segregation protein Spo0J
MRTKITRDHLVVLSGDATIAELQAAADQTKRPTTWPNQLPLSCILVADKVFQWRMRKWNQAASEDHVLELARVIIATEKPLEPIVVFPAGENFYVVDGHHRLEAYHAVDWHQQVPVNVFEGSLDEARDDALASGIKNKLPMTRDDKQEAAFTLVRETDLTAAKITDKTTVSTRQIKYMRAAWREWQGAEHPEDRTGEITWAKVRKWKNGNTEAPDVEEWKEREAQKMVDALLRHKIGQGLGRNPDITALALQRLNPRLPGALIEEWSVEERDLIDEIAGRTMHEF